MIDAVFISDLHLHPDEKLITQKFLAFIAWAKQNTQNIYILGDFFHVWPGDEALDDWSMAIAAQLSALARHGINIFFMPGNRDFLLGNKFFASTHITPLSEPSFITLGQEKVLLVHGDRYCTKDISHQWLRLLTRNKLFITMFLKLPFTLRNSLVTKVRAHSQKNRSKPQTVMDVVPTTMLRHMDKMHVKTVIHGHTHKPGLTTHQGTYKQYVLSDWDNNPQLLCYDATVGFYFYQFSA